MGFKVEMKLKGVKQTRRTIRELAVKAGVTGDKFADYAAKIAQQSVVRNVQPFGPPNKKGPPKKMGEQAVFKSLHNAFKVVPNNYIGNDLVVGVSSAHQIHQAARNHRGRVGHKRKNRAKIKYQLFQQYAATVIAKVGKAKGGFADKSARLGTRIPAWVKRHSSGAGSARRRKGIRGVEWSFDNDQKYTKDSWVMGKGKLRQVLNMQNKMLYNSFKGKLRRAGIKV